MHSRHAIFNAVSHCIEDFYDNLTIFVRFCFIISEIRKIRLFMTSTLTFTIVTSFTANSSKSQDVSFK